MNNNSGPGTPKSGTQSPSGTATPRSSLLARRPELSALSAKRKTSTADLEALFSGAAADPKKPKT